MFLIVNERENVELDTIFMLIILKFLFLLNVLICLILPFRIVSIYK